MFLYRLLLICKIRHWWLSPGGCLNILIFYGKSVLFDNGQKTFLSTTLSRYFVRVHRCNPVPPRAYSCSLKGFETGVTTSKGSWLREWLISTLGIEVDLLHLDQMWRIQVYSLNHVNEVCCMPSPLLESHI